MLAMTMPIAQIVLSPLMKPENPRLRAPYRVGLDDMGSQQLWITAINGDLK